MSDVDSKQLLLCTVHVNSCVCVCVCRISLLNEKCKYRQSLLERKSNTLRAPYRQRRRRSATSTATDFRRNGAKGGWTLDMRYIYETSWMPSCIRFPANNTSRRNVSMRSPVKRSALKRFLSLTLEPKSEKPKSRKNREFLLFALRFGATANEISFDIEKLISFCPYRWRGSRPEITLDLQPITILSEITIEIDVSGTM